ncbi:MAG: DNA-binding protein [Sulfolobales archaeon]
MFKPGPIYLFRVPEDEELISYLTRFAKEKNIKTGVVNAIGALKKCTLGFYDQQKQVYEYIKIEEEVELTNLSGNISIKEGEPFVHVHAVVGKRDGSTYSGHLVEAKVFVAEVLIMELVGSAELVREKHGGLWLWKPGYS